MNKQGDVNIEVGAYRFDPLKGTPAIPRELCYSQKPTRDAYYIVQLVHSPTGPERERLRRGLGLILKDYVAQWGYLERLTPASLSRLRNDALVRSVCRYEPAYKLSPNIGLQKCRVADAPDGLLVWVVLTPTGDSLAVLATARRIGAQSLGVIDDRKRGGRARLRVLVKDQGELAALAQLEDVRWIEQIGELIEDNVSAATTNQSGIAGTGSVWNGGLRGEGQIIGVIDSGPPDLNHCFFQDPIDNAPSFSHRKVVAVRNVSGSAPGGHATFVAGCVAGDDFNNLGAAGRRGGAWAARLVVGNNSDLSTFGGTASLLSELSDAATMGAAIHTNSWHENNVNGSNQANYSQIAADVDAFTWNNEDHLILGSSGNTGEEQGAPGTAKNAICVSAAQADPNEGSLGDGNPGPTADGRQKPDLVGVGCGIQSAIVSTGCTVGPRSACATSYSTPHVAAAAALVRQYFMEGYYPTGTPQPHHAFTPSGALIKATLLNSTLEMAGVPGNIPNNTEGWGLIRLENVAYFEGNPLRLRTWDTRNADGLTTGETREHHVDVATNTQRLKVTLVWTDPPSDLSPTTPLVNILNLQVISPDGTQIFLGNVFAAGVSTTGGTANVTDNIEMVLVANPAPGDWRINVVGNQVNIGEPGQGYALVVTADLAAPPASTGVQNTLVVRVKFRDVAFEPSLPNLQNLMTEVADYVDEVSYGQASVEPTYIGPIQLAHPKSYYYHPERSLLVELTEEVIAALVALDTNVFNGPTGDPADDIDRLILVTNDVNFTEDWATTGEWPYNLPAGLTRPLSVSIQSYANSAARFCHGLLHQLGLVDLYAHPGVVFPRPYVDEWDNMANLFQNVHPLVWSKERAGWLLAHGSTIHYVPRPATGASYTGLNPIPLFLQESTTPNRKAIAIGLTQGAGAITQENVFYYVEARDNALGGYDDNLPSSGVIVYYVNELIPQGEGPVIVLDNELGTASLADAALDIGDSLEIPGTGITITVLAGTGGAAYNIQLAYTPPVTDYNVRITRGDTIDGEFYSYFSPDVWIDSPKNGYNFSAGPPPHTERDSPVIGEVNRIYARIWNDGPAIAYDFDVRFRISEPYHTVGGEADFDRFVGIAHVDSLDPSDGSINVYVEWTPTSTDDKHACVLVDIINLVGTDTNPNDHQAQENLNKVTSITASPYQPVTHAFCLRNPYKEAALFYFRVEGAPSDWTVDVAPRKILLDPAQQMTGTVVLRPPPHAKVCTTQIIKVTSWSPRGDTLINVGGTVVQVDLRRKTAIDLTAGVVPCTRPDLKVLLEQLLRDGQDPQRARTTLEQLLMNDKKVEGYDIREAATRLLYGAAAEKGELIPAAQVLRDWEFVINRIKPTGSATPERPDIRKLLRDCGRIVAQGCTNPPQPFAEIIVKFTAPDGTVTYQTVKTDEHGCYETFIVSVDDGIWVVEAEFPGSRCEAPSHAKPQRICKCGCDCK